MVNFLAQIMNFLVSWQKKTIFHHNPFMHSCFLCGLDIFFWEKMAIYDHYPFLHSFFLCGLDLVSRHKLAIFDHKPFVHIFFLASKLNNYFVSFLARKKCQFLAKMKNYIYNICQFYTFMSIT